MQIAQQGTAADTAINVDVTEPSSAARRSPYADYKIIRRNGAVVGFEPAKISVAMTKAYLAVGGTQGAASARIRELVVELTGSVVNALVRRQPQGGTFHIEDIQDQVELALMRASQHDVARSYVLYREERARIRSEQRAQEKTAKADAGAGPVLHVVEDGQRRPLDLAALDRLLASACAGLEPGATPAAIRESTLRDLHLLPPVLRALAPSPSGNDSPVTT